MWGWLTARFSKLTLGFTLAGLVFGLTAALISLLYSGAGDAGQRAIDESFIYILMLCPPSLGVMALDGPEPWYVIAFAWTGMVLENMVLYGLLGVICNVTWKRISGAPVSAKL